MEALAALQKQICCPRNDRAALAGVLALLIALMATLFIGAKMVSDHREGAERTAALAMATTGKAVETTAQVATTAMEHMARHPVTLKLDLAVQMPTPPKAVKPPPPVASAPVPLPPPPVASAPLPPPPPPPVVVVPGHRTEVIVIPVPHLRMHHGHGQPPAAQPQNQHLQPPVAHPPAGAASAYMPDSFCKGCIYWYPPRQSP